jgi:hypothetical protein
MQGTSLLVGKFYDTALDLRIKKATLNIKEGLKKN